MEQLNNQITRKTSTDFKSGQTKPPETGHCRSLQITLKQINSRSQILYKAQECGRLSL